MVCSVRWLRIPSTIVNEAGVFLKQPDSIQSTRAKAIEVTVAEGELVATYAPYDPGGSDNISNNSNKRIVKEGCNGLTAVIPALKSSHAKKRDDESKTVNDIRETSLPSVHVRTFVKNERTSVQPLKCFEQWLRVPSPFVSTAVALSVSVC